MRKVAEVCVIVPVYRVEQYLHRCVDSILAQTYADFELVLVDDGSPDNSGAICDSYAVRDSRIHVIHQENGGLSAARNAGIDWTVEHSDCQWLTFIDSDDWIHPQMLEILLDMVQSNEKKVSICSYLETAEMVHSEELVHPAPVLWTPENFFVECNTNAVIAWGKLYHRSCFGQVRYPVGKIHEDEFTTYRILFEEPEIIVTDVPLYYYFQNAAGITKSQWNPRRLDALEAQQQQIAYFREKGFIRAHDSVAVWYAGKLCWQRRNIAASALPEAEKERYLMQIRAELRTALRQYWRIYCRRSNLDIFFEIFPVLGSLYRFLRKMGDQ